MIYHHFYKSTIVLNVFLNFIAGFLMMKEFTPIKQQRKLNVSVLWPAFGGGSFIFLMISDTINYLNFFSFQTQTVSRQDMYGCHQYYLHNQLIIKGNYLPLLAHS